MSSDPISIIRLLIPIVRELRTYDYENDGVWPEGYCAECSALLKSGLPLETKFSMGFRVQCGAFPTAYSREPLVDHVWVRFDNLNIDFTGHQFPELVPYVVDVDGFDVIFGSDEYMRRLGYIFYSDEQCAEALMLSGLENMMRGLWD